jgi:hypothetical protein
VNEFGFRDSAPVIGQSYRPHKDTETVRRREALDRLAYGDRPPDEIQRAKDKNAQPFAHARDGKGVDSLDYLRSIQAPTYLPRAGEQIGAASAHRIGRSRCRCAATSRLRLLDQRAESPQVDAAPLGHVDAAMRLQALMGDGWTPDMFERLAELYPAGVPEDELRRRRIGCSATKWRLRATCAR